MTMKTIATSKTRISQTVAQIIARKVANAAFEHIAKPLVKKSDGLVIHHYKTFFASLDTKTLDALNNSGLINPVENSTDLDAILVAEEFKEDESRKYRLRVHCELDASDMVTRLSTRYASAPLIHIPLVEFEKVQAVLSEIEDKRNKHSALAAEVADQITGKSIATVVKNWPEIESFVLECYEIHNPDGMVTPFSSVLSKYLPALPAPETKESA